MRSKISKTSISLICLMLVATSAEAGYKSIGLPTNHPSAHRPLPSRTTLQPEARQAARLTIRQHRLAPDH